MNYQNPKYFKNPARNQPPPSFQPYTPQYQQMGIIPAVSGEVMSSKEKPMKPPFATYVLPKQQKQRPLLTTQNIPYAEVGQPSFGGALPNVGNNNERTWSGLDEMIVDDLSDIDMNQPMIDNNDFIKPPEASANQNFMQTSPLPSMRTAREYRTEAAQAYQEQEVATVCDTAQLNVNYEEYILLLKGEVLLTGALEQVQLKVQELVLDSVFVDELIVLKRVKIKVGVFIE